MSPQKARDLFSAAVEGTLDSGLRASFDRALASDPHLSSEFQAFRGLYDGLHALADAPIEVPFGLADRISARIDHDKWERQRNRPVIGGAWLRSLALGMAATVLILGTVASLRGGGKTFSAGLTLDQPVATPLEIRQTDLGVEVSSGPLTGTIKVRNGETGDVIDEAILRGDSLRRPVRYAGERPIFVVIEQVGQPERLSVVLPGSQRGTLSDGEGTILEAAKAAAIYYRIPVMIAVPDPQAKTHWKFAPGVGSPGDAPGSRFEPASLALSQSNGMLVLRTF